MKKTPINKAERLAVTIAALSASFEQPFADLSAEIVRRFVNRCHEAFPQFYALINTPAVKYLATAYDTHMYIQSESLVRTFATKPNISAFAGNLDATNLNASRHNGCTIPIVSTLWVPASRLTYAELETIKHIPDEFADKHAALWEQLYQARNLLTQTLACYKYREDLVEHLPELAAYLPERTGITAGTAVVVTRAEQRSKLAAIGLIKAGV